MGPILGAKSNHAHEDVSMLPHLEEFAEKHTQGGHPNPHLSDKMKKLDLAAQDKEDLVNFMKACTGEFPKIEPGRLPA